VFKYHNVKLNDGSCSISNSQMTMDAHPMFLVAKNILEKHYLNTDLTSKKLIDIGCLEGGYTLEFAKMGFDSLGLEVRESNF